MMKSGREYLPLYFFIGNFVEFSYKKIKPSGQECTAAEWNHVAEATRRRHRKNPAKQDSFCAVEKAWKKKTVRFAIMTNSAQGRYYNHSHTGNV